MTHPKFVLWEIDQVGEALETLVKRAGLRHDEHQQTQPPPKWERCQSEALNDRLTQLGLWQNVEIQPIEGRYQEMDQCLRKVGPALMAVSTPAGLRLLAVLRANRTQIVCLGPGARTFRISPAKIRHWIHGDMDETTRHQIDTLLNRLNLNGSSRKRAYETMRDRHCHDTMQLRYWMIRPKMSSPLRRLIVTAGIPIMVLGSMLSYLIWQTLWIAAWWILGSATLSGRLDQGWLTAWVFCILGGAAFSVANHWYGSQIMLAVASLLKRRLLHGALQMDPDVVKGEGSGKLLARAFEAELVEGTSLNMVLQFVFLIFDLMIAVWLLSQGIFPALAWILILWVALVCLLGRSLYRRAKAWADDRLQMTYDLVEQIQGHRTRLAQEQKTQWHEREDWFLARYLEQTKAFDQRISEGASIPGRGWLAIGVISLAPAWILYQGDGFALALSLGGLFLAGRALTYLTVNLPPLMTLLIALKNLTPLLKAAARQEPPTIAIANFSQQPSANGTHEHQVILEADGLKFRYRNGEKPVLNGCRITIRRGDRILLEGESGCGKSTLVATILGLYQPESGLVLLNGLDRRSMGSSTWHRKISAAPQFHDNYIFSGSLAYNLLMGRQWPPSRDDLAEAQQLCIELGLEDLILGMPAGLHQWVGDGGWRLSHGEQSRIFIARGLLQNADLIIFDESFGTLDPETMQMALNCVFRRAPALLVIAHP